MECKECGKELRVEMAEEITRYFKRMRKVKIYYCFNPNCTALPYFYRERMIEIDACDLEVMRNE